MLENKSVQLENNVEKRKTILRKEITENRQPVPSGSGLPFSEQIAPGTFAIQAMRPPLTGGSQGDLPTFEGQERDSVPININKEIVVFCLVLCLMRRQDKVATMEMVNMVILLDQELYNYNNRGSRHSIWESSPKTLLFFMDAPMRMS